MQNQPNCVKISDKIMKTEPEFDGQVEGLFSPIWSKFGLDKEYVLSRVTLDGFLDWIFDLLIT
jgi:hypothetical protein